MLWFTLFFLWIWMFVVVIGDVFRSPDLSGWGKAMWTLFIIVLPYLGLFAYLIARGSKITEHRLAAAHRADLARRAYIRDSLAAP